MLPLPIDPLLPEAVERLRASGALVLMAAPGAGKTTRLPRALLEAGFAQGGEIVVLEPRRLAARLAARRVAEELGERVGERVGYQVRFEDVSGPRTALRFVTEGLLTRRLVSDPTLRGVSVVVLDELHERSVHTDLALALLRRLQRGARPELKLVAMSATLDPEPVAEFLGGAPILESAGRQFEVRIEHLPLPDARPLDQQVASALRRLLAAGVTGHVLVFLPGAAEIRRAAEAVAPLAQQGDLAVLPLHGSLTAEEQDRAVRPSERRKVILATNVAETSITIDGVAAVIDGGLARVAGNDAWSGLPTLKVAKVSRASAAQRAGRAGRTRDGVALRLYTRHDHDGRPAYETPELLRVDLAEPLLALEAAGVARADDLAWFEAPPPEALRAAEELLAALGALDAAGALTETGRKLARLPLHPRLGRLVVEAVARGAGESGCELAAFLAERDVRVDRGRLRAGPSDPLEVLALAHGRDAARLDRVARQLVRIAGARDEKLTEPQREEALQIALLTAFPDRVARRRKTGSDELLLCGGGAAKLARESVVRDAALVVAVEAEQGRAVGHGTSVLVRSASAIEPGWLVDLFPERVREEDQVSWDAEAERVRASSRLVYGQIAIDESAGARGDPARVAAVLAEAALAKGPRAFAPPEEVDRLIARVAFARERRGAAALPALGEAELRETLADLCQGRRSFAELRDASLLEVALSRLTYDQRRLLEDVAPETLPLPSGRRARVEYAAGQPPWLASRLQDFFGPAAGPAIDGGRLPLVLHLLAPNQRAVQVTSDLAGFWDRTYPSVRQELSRRYPRHAWPENPRVPPPPRPRSR
ncbi:MAG TPA: ATP-dependent helicase HrpB [Myxococcales bacterium]|nr:ATP-dependent helicase HrpB [Myxococcales bacterium]